MNSNGSSIIIKKDSKWNFRKNWRSYMFVIAILAYPLGLTIFFFSTINILSIIMSFQSYDYFGNATFVGFKNYAEVIKTAFEGGELFAISLANSLLMYIIPLFIMLPLYIFFSYYIFKKARGGRLTQFVSMITRLIPGMVFALTFKMMVESALPSIFLQFGVDMPKLFGDPKYTFGTTIFYTCWLSFSTSLIVYPNAMNSIQQEIFESASIDGCDNIFSELWYIILPLIFPTLETFLVTGFASIFENSGPLITFWLYDAPREVWNVPYFLYIRTFRSSNTMGHPFNAATGVILTAIVAPLTMLLRWALDKFGPSVE